MIHQPSDADFVHVTAFPIPIEEAIPETAPRGFRRLEVPFHDYRGSGERIFTVQESSLATERRLWVGPTDAYADLNGDGALTLMERAHLDEDTVRKVRDAMTAWLGE